MCSKPVHLSSPPGHIRAQACRRPWHCPIFPVQKESLPAHHSSSSVWDDAHFPLRPGVWFPKLWVPYYHVLISASPILPNKVILWRCGSLRKQTHQHMVWWNFTNTRTQIPTAPCVDRLSSPGSHMSSLWICALWHGGYILPTVL